MKKPKLSIIIPVLNEMATLPELLKKIATVELRTSREVVLVDAGSSDGSRELIASYGGQLDYRIVLLGGPAGKGDAVLAGLKISSGEIILIQDGDLEYDPADYPAVIAPLLDGQTKFVMGSRLLGAGTWWFRDYATRPFYGALMNLGAEALSWLFRIVYGVRVTDPQSMYKVFHRDCLRGLSLQSRAFDLDWEILGKFVLAGYHPVEIPVQYQARTPENGKKLRIWPDGFRAVLAILRFRFMN